MTDDIDHDGSLSGYYIYSTAKGDQLILKVSGNSQKKAGEDLAYHQETGRIISGTGLYRVLKEIINHWTSSIGTNRLLKSMCSDKVLNI